MKNIKPLIILVLATAGVFMLRPLSLASAQTTAAAPAAPSSNAKVEQDANGALYLEFKSATLLNVLIALSEVSKINFVAGTEIAQRQINMNLDGVTLQQALDAIANGSNVTYDYIPKSNIFMFRASSDAPQLAPLFTRVFKLYFLRASVIREINAGQSSGGSNSGTNLITGGSSGSSSGGSGGSSSSAANTETAFVKALEKMLSERGSISVDDRSNSLIATDSADRLDRLAAVIAELDRPLNQVLISVLLLETFEDLSRELGIQWATDLGQPGGDGAWATLGGAQRDSLAPFEPSFTGSNNTGLSGFFSQWFGLHKFEPSTFDFSSTPPTFTTVFKPGTQDFRGLSQTVKALQTASKLRILAKPNILVMDNHPAIVKIVTNATIGSQTQTAAVGGSAATSTASTAAERAEIGTILRVTPQINTQDRITLTIEPTFSTLEKSSITLSGSSPGATADPTVRAARTTLMVNSGSTLVMGGLMFSDQETGDRKVPYLGDLPVIGNALFTSKTKKVQDRELVLFLSPTVVKNPKSLDPGKMPTRDENFGDINADFWKYRKKTWYKDMQNPPMQPKAYEDYFKLRETAMDSAAAQLEQGRSSEQLNKDRESSMKQDISQTGQPTEIKWKVQ